MSYTFGFCMKVLAIASDSLKLKPLTTRLNQAGIDTIDWSDPKTVGNVVE
ncbi:MAG: hypothetical protein WCD18_12025 [Thermosynechococcaceae cyanobacterium]